MKVWAFRILAFLFLVTGILKFTETTKPKFACFEGLKPVMEWEHWQRPPQVAIALQERNRLQRELHEMDKGIE